MKMIHETTRLKIEIEKLQELIEQLQEKLDLQTEPISDVVQFWVDASAEKDTLIEQKDAEIARLRQALISERDEALKWDGIGTVSRINKVLKGADTCAP